MYLALINTTIYKILKRLKIYGFFLLLGLSVCNASSKLSLTAFGNTPSNFYIDSVYGDDLSRHLGDL
jgi:hypothetical protein